jgi:hypothetical protein
MPKVCQTSQPGGINLDCLKYPSPIDNIIITDNDVSFTEAEILLLSNWKTDIQENLTIYIPSIIESYENTTDDPALTATGIGRKTMGRKPVPSGVFNVRSNVCDFNELLRTLKGGTYRIFFVHADNTFSAFKDRNSADIMGFQCELNAVTKGFAAQDIQDTMYPIFANFMNYKEFEQQYHVEPNWTIQNELPPAMPESYTMQFVSQDTVTKKVTVNVFEACGDAVVGLVIADVNVIEDTLTDSTVFSVTDNGSGNYDIVFTTVAAGEDVEFDIRELTGTVVDNISPPVYQEFE